MPARDLVVNCVAKAYSVLQLHSNLKYYRYSLSAVTRLVAVKNFIWQYLLPVISDDVFQITFSVRAAITMTHKNPALPDLNARQFGQKHSQPVFFNFFCLNTEKPQAIGNANLSIPKSWKGLLFYECQLHGMTWPMWHLPQMLPVCAGCMGLNHRWTVETFGILVATHRSLEARWIQRH